jgi:predicted nucleic acid-binding Zn finger protein
MKGRVMKQKLTKGIYIRLSLQELQQIQILKEKYAFNISILVRKHLREVYQQYESPKILEGRM